MTCLFNSRYGFPFVQTIATYNSSVTLGTAANRHRQATIYLKFCIAYNVQYLNPTILDISMFVRFLANSFNSPSTTKNYIAGAKTWVQNHMGSLHAFMSPQVHDMILSITKASDHIPAPAHLITPADLGLICAFIDCRCWIPPACKAALLIGYATFLRSSNILSPSLSSWGGPHTLKFCDVVPKKSGLAIIIRSSKTLYNSRPVVLEVHSVNDLPLCPVRAWWNYVSNVKPCSTGPAFVLNSTTPLTPRPLVKIMRAALSLAHRPYANSVSMHSLRRGASQALAAAGASDSDLLQHGTWKSKSVL